LSVLRSGISAFEENCNRVCYVLLVSLIIKEMIVLGGE
jgi:hypothetical protein